MNFVRCARSVLGQPGLSDCFKIAPVRLIVLHEGGVVNQIQVDLCELKLFS